MNRRRFFGYAAGMLGAGLFWGAGRGLDLSEDGVDCDECGATLIRGRNRDGSKKPFVRGKWYFDGKNLCAKCGDGNFMHDGPRLWMYTAEGKRVFPSGQKARDFYEKGI